MLVHVNANDRGFAHPDAGTPVAGDEAAEELEEIRVVPDEKDILAVGVSVNQLLKICVAGAEVERGTDLNLSFITELIPYELCGLEGSFERAGHDDVWLDLQSAEKPSHQHALFFALGDEAALGIELRTFARNSGVGMTHQVEVHDGGWV